MGKITDHGRIRLKERTNITRPKLSHINKILKNGKSSEDYKDEFKKYLEKKGIGGAKVKVYDNQIYIFSRNLSVSLKYEKNITSSAYSMLRLLLTSRRRKAPRSTCSPSLPRRARR